MPSKGKVRRLPIISSFHIPVSHRRYQNRAAAVYDMSIDCHDIDTVCHIHRLSQAVVLRDWKGDINYLKTKMNLSNRKEIKRRFRRVLKEIQEDEIQPTLAAIANFIPFVYVEQALAEKEITNAVNRFCDDFHPSNIQNHENHNNDHPIQNQLNRGFPVLTPYEKHLLLEHFVELISAKKRNRFDLKQIEACLLSYIQQIITINFTSAMKISHIDRTWLKEFLNQAKNRIETIDFSHLNLDRY